MSAVGSSTISGDAVVLLDLAVGGRRRPEVGHGGGHDDHVGRSAARHDGRLHLGRGLHVDDARRPAATGRSTVVTRVTLAPRAAASSARA